MTEYKYFTFDEIGAMAYDLGDKIKNDNFKPDCLIGIIRGGLFVVRIISDRFPEADVFTIRTKYYTGIGQTSGELKILQPAEREWVEGRKVLLVDEVVETGESLYRSLEHIISKGPKEVRTAALHTKPQSKKKIIPNYSLEETDRWIIYPWEVNEAVSELSQKFPGEALLNELERTGIPKEMYQRFL
ncbi:MAG: phosphoribosyltransferase [Candidatus Aenigmarchaeota archaeon]|nr:phosphoribosyltransferase [Candidatus Aenigmarchaeota archaeon]